MLGETETDIELVRDPAVTRPAPFFHAYIEASNLADQRLQTIRDLARDLDRWRTRTEHTSEALDHLADAYGSVATNYRTLQADSRRDQALLLDVLTFLQTEIWPTIARDGFDHPTIYLDADAADTCQRLLATAAATFDVAFTPVPA